MELSLPASNIRQLFADLLDYFAAAYRNVFDLTEGPPLHDPIAVAVLLDEKELLFERKTGDRYYIDVVTDGAHSKKPEEHGQAGRTIASLVPPTEAGGVRIPQAVDTKRLWELIDNALTVAEERVQEQTDS